MRSKRTETDQIINGRKWIEVWFELKWIDLFQVWYSQDSAYSATVQTSLKSLVLEDLNVKEDSKYRRLVITFYFNFS